MKHSFYTIIFIFVSICLYSGCARPTPSQNSSNTEDAINKAVDWTFFVAEMQDQGYKLMSAQESQKWLLQRNIDTDQLNIDFPEIIDRDGIRITMDNLHRPRVITGVIIKRNNGSGRENTKLIKSVYGVGDKLPYFRESKVVEIDTIEHNVGDSIRFREKGAWLKLKDGTRYICETPEGCEVEMTNFTITKGKIAVYRNKE